MVYFRKYKTPGGFDDLLMYSDGVSLTGLWFEGSRDEIKHKKNCEEKQLPIFIEAEKWLDRYFSGNPETDLPQMKIDGFTAFRRDVFEIMKSIPYGKTMTYGEIAEKIARKRGLKKMSAQAVGGAVEWNPICIMIPCHRVVGTDGSLTGYGGGIENKRQLLYHEKGNL